MPKLVDERRVEGNGDGDVADEPAAARPRRLAGRTEDGRTADDKAVDRGDGDAALRVQHLLEAREVAAPRDRCWKMIPCDRGRLLLGRVQRGPGSDASRDRMPGLDACVDLPRLALPRDLREPPEGGPDRQQRKQQEIDDELDLEATHEFRPSLRRCSSVGPSLPIPRSSDVVGIGGAEHEGYRSGSCSASADRSDRGSSGVRALERPWPRGGRAPRGSAAAEPRRAAGRAHSAHGGGRPRPAILKLATTRHVTSTLFPSLHVADAERTLPPVTEHARPLRVPALPAVPAQPAPKPTIPAEPTPAPAATTPAPTPAPAAPAAAAPTPIVAAPVQTPEPRIPASAPPPRRRRRRR